MRMRPCPKCGRSDQLGYAPTRDGAGAGCIRCQNAIVVNAGNTVNAVAEWNRQAVTLDDPFTHEELANQLADATHWARHYESVARITTNDDLARVAAYDQAKYWRAKEEQIRAQMREARKAA